MMFLPIRNLIPTCLNDYTEYLKYKNNYGEKANNMYYISFENNKDISESNILSYFKIKLAKE